MFAFIKYFLKRGLSNIILSRPDSIGDVILTLPMAKILKDHFKNIKVYFLGKEYTRSVVQACNYVDDFIEVNDFLSNGVRINDRRLEAIIHVKPERAVAEKAKQLNIKLRIGTTNRLFHWTTCNKLVALSRRKSNLHEAQLNLKLLSGLGIDKIFYFNEIIDAYGFNNFQPLQEAFARLIDPNKYNIILHPKSQGSSREWGLENFKQLIFLLNKTRYKIFISGTEAEKMELTPLLSKTCFAITDISGAMPLQQFISFIAACDGLVACSTGPLHIAAASGIDAYGIYPPIKPLHPERWKPLGNKALAFCLDKDCNNCKNNPAECTCIKSITANKIFNAIEQQAALKFT